jgi:hypothetical protein
MACMHASRLLWTPAAARSYCTGACTRHSPPIPQHNTTQHNTTQHNTTQHNTTQHNTTQHSTAQHNTTQHIAADEAAKAAASSAAEPSEEELARALGSTMRLSLTEQERQAREAVRLPYEHRGEGRLYQTQVRGAAVAAGQTFPSWLHTCTPPTTTTTSPPTHPQHPCRTSRTTCLWRQEAVWLVCPTRWAPPGWATSCM